MTDSTTEGIKSTIAKIHGCDPKKVGRWAAEGMPLDIVGAEEWLKVKRRGNYQGAKVEKNDANKGSKKAETAFGEILRKGNAASSGVFGVFHRSAAIEAACYKACLADPTAANVTAHARARASLVEAAEQVEAHELRSGVLIDAAEFRRAIQSQDGCSVALITAMPYALADLILGQPREVIIQTLQTWGAGFLKKRRETEPFQNRNKSEVTADSIFEEAEKEAGKE